MYVISNHISTYLNFTPLKLAGTTVAKRNFTPSDVIGTAWSGCMIVQKSYATQLQDHALIFRIMRDTTRVTLTVRISGAINLRIRSKDGSIQRDVQTTAIPTLNNTFIIGYSWDKTTASLTVYDWTTKSVVQSVSSATNVSSLSPFTEIDGVYIGNREDLTLPYRGNVYGGCFGLGRSYGVKEMEAEFKTGNTCMGRNFLIHPKVMGYKDTNIIREPNHLDLTIITPDFKAFWN